MLTPEGFIGISTSITAIIGLILSLYQYYRNYTERRISQAKEIGAWWVRIDEGNRKNIGRYRFSKTPFFEYSRYWSGILITNNSGAPVYDLIIKAVENVMRDGERSNCGFREVSYGTRILPPGEYITVRADPKLLDKTDGTSWAYAQEKSSFDGRIRPIVNSKTWEVRSIEFTDASGKRWRREIGKKLILLTSTKGRIARFTNLTSPIELDSKFFENKPEMANGPIELECCTGCKERHSTSGNHHSLEDAFDHECPPGTNSGQSSKRCKISTKLFTALQKIKKKESSP